MKRGRGGGEKDVWKKCEGGEGCVEGWRMSGVVEGMCRGVEWWRKCGGWRDMWKCGVVEEVWSGGGYVQGCGVVEEVWSGGEMRPIFE